MIPRKYRALRLDAGNYAWGSENVTKKALRDGGTKLTRLATYCEAELLKKGA